MVKKRKNVEQVSFLLKGIPIDVHRKFKAHCVVNDIAMTQKLIKYMQQVIREDEQAERHGTIPGV